MKFKKYIFVLMFIMTVFSSLGANTLLEYYHANYGPVERVVFVFSEYPRYRVREDPLSVNLSFLDTQKAEIVASKRILENPVISKITVVPTDAFVGILVNTYDDYKIEEFVFKSDNKYKLVLDVFQHVIPPSPEDALLYAKFYKTINNPAKARYYENLADSLRNAAKIKMQQENNKQPEPPEIDPDNPPVVVQEVIEEKSTPQQEQPKTKTTQQIITTPEQPRDSGWIPERVKEIALDIFQDRMLMFSIIVVFFVIAIMLIMSLLRKLHKPEETAPAQELNSFGSTEFQRVTIKRLLANGWRIESIAKELNLTPREVEELGR